MSDQKKSLIDVINQVHNKKNESIDEGIFDAGAAVVSKGVKYAKQAVPVIKNIAKNVVGGFKGRSPVGLPQTAETLPGKSPAQIAAAFPQKAGPVSTGAAAVGSAIKKGTDFASKPTSVAAAGGAATGAAVATAIAKKDSSKSDENSSGGTTTLIKSQDKPKTDTTPAAPKASEPPKAEPPKEKKTFGQAFAAARKEAGGGDGKFSFGGKDFQTNVKGEKYKTPDKLKATSVKEENMTSPLIDSFLKLQGLKSSNMFEAAKKLDPRGGDTIGSGTVTSGGKDVVSKTAPKASTTGPSDADKKALTDKIKTITKEEVETVEEAKKEAKKEGYQNWPGEKKKAFFNGPKDKDGKTETQKWAEKKKAEKECTKEEVEQIDELSRKTLSSYVNKAAKSAANKAASSEIAREFGDKEKSKADNKKAGARLYGIYQASKRLAKEEIEISEEVEQIDEVSKKTLGSYIKKASLSKGAKDFVAGAIGAARASSKIKEPFEHEKHLDKKSKSRQKYIGKAVDKLTKEDVEFSEAELAHFESLIKTEE